MLRLADGLDGDVRSVVATALSLLLADAAGHPGVHQLTDELVAAEFLMVTAGAGRAGAPASGGAS